MMYYHPTLKLQVINRQHLKHVFAGKSLVPSSNDCSSKPCSGKLDCSVCNQDCRANYCS
ncbi:MAG: hypothetical protein QM528_07670 [Phycisphaerales bacterium]|nr:hypothetical protein [Phycisphaerales bacterium]